MTDIAAWAKHLNFFGTSGQVHPLSSRVKKTIRAATSSTGPATAKVRTIVNQSPAKKRVFLFLFPVLENANRLGPWSSWIQLSTKAIWSGSKSLGFLCIQGNRGKTFAAEITRMGKRKEMHCCSVCQSKTTVMRTENDEGHFMNQN